MVLIHLLGLLDLFAALMILGGHFGMFGAALLYAAIYLFTKIFFFRDWMSVVDVFAAVYAVFLFFADGGNGLTWLFMIWFLYKFSIWMFFTLTN